MSINFHANITDANITNSDSPCLCAQMADMWVDAMDGHWSEAVKANLASEANPKCPFCKGTGIEAVRESDAPVLNLANGNAVLLLGALGLDSAPSGELSVPEARRAIIRARSRSDLTPFTREQETVYGRPRANEDGSVELRPVRLSSMGVDKERVASYIERFASLVEESADRGATTIFWD